MEKFSSGEYAWYAVYTKPRHEKKVAVFLTELGIHYYLPLQKVLRQWTDRKKWVEEPIIRGYIFVKLSNDKEYMDVLHTDGTIKVITFEGLPAPIPEYQINNLKLIFDSKIDFEVVKEKLDPGQAISVVGGTLNGLQGILLSFLGKNKVMVEIEHIGRSIIVSIPVRYLRRRVEYF